MRNVKRKDDNDRDMCTFAELAEEYDRLAYYIGTDHDGNEEAVLQMYEIALAKTGVANGEDDDYLRYHDLTFIDFKAISDKYDGFAKEKQYSTLQTAGKLAKVTNEDKLNFFAEWVIPVFKRRLLKFEGMLYFRTDYGYWLKMDPTCSVMDIIDLFFAMLPQMEVTRGSSVNKRSRDMLDETIKYSGSYVGDATIQFNDCIFTGIGGFKQQPGRGFPRYFFDRDIYHVIENGKPTLVVPEVDDLLDHLANGDEEVRDCLIDRIAMSLITSVAKKRQLEAKAVILYGPTAENGKSTFVELVKRAFDYENVTSFEFNAFSGYSVAEVKRNLLLTDDDASNAYVTSDVTAAIKKCITSDGIQVRQIYQAPETVTPFTQFLVCINSMPKAEDKTRGWDRRLEWFEVREKLVRDRKWFDAIESDEAAEYLFELLALAADKLSRKRKRIMTPEVLLTTNKTYSNANKNIVAWLESVKETTGKVAPEYLNRRPAGLVYADYESWCLGNAETPLGRTNFNSILAAETGMVGKNIRLKADTDIEAFEWWQSLDATRTDATAAIIKCWARP